jgi:hypothetical protein
MNDQTKPLRETVEKFEALTALPDFNELKAHEIAKEDPLMNMAEFEALKVSIKASGIREPITLFRDQGQLWVLDGRNRMNAGVAEPKPTRPPVYTPRGIRTPQQPGQPAARAAAPVVSGSGVL